MAGWKVRQMADSSAALWVVESAVRSVASMAAKKAVWRAQRTAELKAVRSVFQTVAR